MIASGTTRQGMATLVAALNLLKVAELAACGPRHRRQEFLPSLHEIDDTGACSDFSV